MDKKSTTTFMSYNLTRLDSAKTMFILDICEQFDVDFLSLQEHFKFVNAAKYFKSGFGDFSSYVVPGHRSLGQFTGRAKAGLGQLSRRKLAVQKNRVSSNGFRIQAQVLIMLTSRILWINSYLPNDPQLQQYDDAELLEFLEQIRCITETAEYDDIIWGSDLNWDPDRDTQFSRTLSNFLKELGLVS